MDKQLDPGYYRDKILSWRGCTLPYADQLFAYVIRIYHPDSPLRESFPNIDKRKLKAAQESGLVDGVSSEVLKKIFEIDDDDILKVVADFLIFTNDRSNTLRCLNEQALSEYTSIVLKKITITKKTDGDEILKAAKVKSDLLKQCDDIDIRLKAIYKEMSGGDTIAEKVISRAVSPESIAESI